MTLSNPINPTFEPSFIDVNGTIRTYYLSGNAKIDSYHDKKLPILLLFHGFNEEVYQPNPPSVGVLNFTQLYSVNALHWSLGLKDSQYIQARRMEKAGRMLFQSYYRFRSTMWNSCLRFFEPYQNVYEEPIIRFH